jgi:hypothetical protein
MMQLYGWRGNGWKFLTLEMWPRYSLHAPFAGVANKVVDKIRDFVYLLHL